MNNYQNSNTILRRSIIIGGVAALISLVGALFETRDFLTAYLEAYLFTLAIPLGSLAILMLHNLTGGEWGLVMRPVLLAAMRMIMPLAILFLPVIIWSAEIYPWMNNSWTNYLTPFFAFARTIFYFFIWIGTASLLHRTINNSALGDTEKKRKLQLINAPGLLLYFLTMTFASFDWMVSLDAQWSSTIYGLIIIGGQGISALCFAIIILAWKEGAKPEHFHDLGKLLLAFVMLWAYFAFSQYLIIWSGNLPDEITWFLARIRGGWEPVGILVVAVHFAVPFFLLLSQRLKRNARRLSLVALTLLSMRWIDTIWYIEPAFYPGKFHLSWLHISLPIAFCAIGFAYFLYCLQTENG